MSGSASVPTVWIPTTHRKCTPQVFVMATVSTIPSTHGCPHNNSTRSAESARGQGTIRLMTRRTLQRAAFFWLFVTLSAYLVYIYPVQRLTDWLGRPDLLKLPSTVGLWMLMIAILWLSFRRRSRVLEWILFNWLGVGFVFCVLCLVYDLVRLINPLNDQAAAAVILLMGAGLVTFSFITAQTTTHKTLRFHSHRLRKDYRLVQISDVHIGSRSSRFLDHIVQSIQTLHPDMVLITGDFLDSSRIRAKDIKALKTLAMPVYLSIGNHERYIGLDKVVPLLEDTGVRVLRNNSVYIDGLQLIGIDDADDVHQVGRELADITLDPQCFKVLLYHRPLGWDSAVKAGIDLTLSGHTHNGQIFPFNYLVRQQFKLITGLHRSGHCQLYVSPGTGTWGPVMRLGSRNEITCIDLIASGL
ncbi:MAG TPA: hypothetical protein EYM85_07600 [Gammaproteobacteria bacterium]|nr:hypothetical protein [Gammaproteobacteria bacterium]